MWQKYKISYFDKIKNLEKVNISDLPIKILIKNEYMYRLQKKSELIDVKNIGIIAYLQYYH